MMKLRFYACFILLIQSLGCSSQKENGPEQKILIDIGDSLTAGAGGDGVTMSTVTQAFLGPLWQVQNMGVGGENTLTIGARYGAMPMYIKQPIVIPKDGSKVPIAGGLYSSFNDQAVLPLLQGDAGINPCYVGGIKCRLTKTGDTYYLNRMHRGAKDVTTQPKSVIVTSLSQTKADIVTIFIGQNGSYGSPEELLEQIDLFVKHKGDERVIIITSHGNADAQTVAPIIKKYGDKVIDFKKYMATTAIYDAIKQGLLPDNGTYPTAQDLEMMENGNAPPSLLIDMVHLNKAGYTLLGKLRAQRGQLLGYW